VEAGSLPKPLRSEGGNLGAQRAHGSASGAATNDFTNNAINACRHAQPFVTAALRAGPRKLVVFRRTIRDAAEAISESCSRRVNCCAPPQRLFWHQAEEKTPGKKKKSCNQHCPFIEVP
jgi:hypothetical protein